MGKVVLANLGIGAIGAIVIVLLGFMPLIGILLSFFLINYLIWIGFWIWLSSRLVSTGRAELARSDNPRIPAMAWGALLGGVTGFVGAACGLLINLVIAAIAANAASNGSGAAGLTAFGASVGVVGGLVALGTYPVFGMFWCGLFGLIWGGRAERRLQHAADV